jgi:hypothetical protein
MNADSKITPSCAHGPPSNKKKQFQRHRKTIQFSQSVQLMTTCWVCAIVKQKTKKLQPFIPWKPTYLTGPADSKIMNVYISADIGLNKETSTKKQWWKVTKKRSCARVDNNGVRGERKTSPGRYENRTQSSSRVTETMA